MAFRIVRNDITKVKADAIVNTANPEPTYADGTDRAIYEAAGAELLLNERTRIGRLKIGQAAPTPAFALPARYIIHTVGPEWIDGEHGETEDLRHCYENSLEVAVELGCSSVAFPLIATGVYGFPKAEALKVAVQVFSEFLTDHEMKIILVVFDSEAFVLSGKIFAEIDAYIDEKTVEAKRKEEYGAGRRPVGSKMPTETKLASAAMMECRDAVYGAPAEPEKCTAAEMAVPEDTLEERMKNIDETWASALLWWIDEKGYTDVEVYKRANVDRKLFSKIRSKEEYQPKKMTAVAFALALRLDLDETQDLLRRAGFALSKSNKFDLIIEYFIEHGIYDTYTINLALFDHKQPLLGE